MQLALIGTVMHDQIETVDGRRFESFGGILYNAMALATVTGPGDRIMPLALLAAEHRDYLAEHYFRRFPQIDPSRLTTNPGGTDANILKYVTTSSRRERMTIVAPPLDAGHFEAAAEADAVLVNFISGVELMLESLAELRRMARGPIFLDVHNLGKLRRHGVPVPGHRFRDWAAWFRCVDLVQANEWEAERLFDINPRTDADCRAALRQMMQVETIRAGILTLGDQGAAIAWREPDDALHFFHVPAMQHPEIADTTGCGDCFSAGFLVSYLKTGDPLSSALFASTLSGLNCRVKGLDGLVTLSGVPETLQREYGALQQRVADGWRGEKL